MKVHRWTLDLLLVVALTVLADFVVLFAEVEGSVVRIAVLLPLVLVLPGYALVGVMYPRGSATDSSRDSQWRHSVGDRGIGTTERLGLSIAGSLAVVPLLAFGLNFTPAGIQPVPLLLSVSWFTVIFSFLAFVRRLGVPPEQRFQISPLSRVGQLSSRYFGVGRGSLAGRRPFEATTGTHRLLNLLLVASLLVLAGSVAYAAILPSPSEEAFTEFYLVTEDESGEYTTDELPDELAVGQPTPISVAVSNHEGEPVTYTTVVKLQEIQEQDGETRIVEDSELDRIETQVPPGETRITDISVTPSRGGESLQLVFLLYAGDVPEDPTHENAYLVTHLQVTVRGGAG